MEADMSDIQKKPQRFCLRWNNFHSNIVSAFESLRKEEDFVDVTLACDGGSIKAHKMILSACSPYFKDLLKDNPCQHPIVILRDVSFSQLESLLQFVYHGEVNVSHDQLPEFLRTAEVLRIRGLADDRQDSTGSPSPPSTPQNRQQSNPPTPSSPSNEQQPQNSKRIKLELTNDKSETHKEQIEPENLSMSNSDKVTQPKREVIDDYENYDDDNSLTEMDDEESKSLSGSLAPGNIAKMVNMMESYRHMAHSLNPALGHFGQFNSGGHLTAGFNPTCSSPIPGRNLTSTPPGSGGGSDSETHRMMNQHRIRKPRTVFSPVQLNMLRSYFSQNQHPTSHEMQYLADKLFLQRGVVKVWFQNERAKIRRIIKQEPGSMVSNTSPDSGNSLSSVHDTNHSQEQDPLMSSNWTPHNSGSAQALSLNPHNTSASQSQSLNPNSGSTQPLNLNLGTNHVPSNSNSEPISEDEDEVAVKREMVKQNETE